MNALNARAILLYNLAGRLKKAPRRVQISPEEALRRLKEASGQDYGYDAKAWRNYIRLSGGWRKALPGLYGQKSEKRELMQPAEYPEVNELIAHLLANMQRVLSSKLVGVYLHGSLVHGDFDIAMSDVDLMAAITTELTETEARALEQMYGETSQKFPVWHDRIETAYLSLNALKTFKTQASKIGNVSPGEPFHIIDADRDWLPNWYMVQEKGKTLLGPPPGTLIDPISKDEFVATLKQNHLSYWRGYSQRNTEDRLPSQAYVRLTMCRALYTTTHGEQVSKVKAAQWAAETFPQWRALIEQALIWRKAWRDEAINQVAAIDDTQRFIEFTLAHILGEQP